MRQSRSNADYRKHEFCQEGRISAGDLVLERARGCIVSSTDLDHRASRYRAVREWAYPLDGRTLPRCHCMLHTVCCGIDLAAGIVKAALEAEIVAERMQARSFADGNGANVDRMPEAARPRMKQPARQRPGAVAQARRE